MSQPTYIVRLRPGTNATQFKAHTDLVATKCKDAKYSKDAAGKPYAGIQTRLELVFFGYTGQFHPDLLKEIDKLPEVESVDQDHALQSMETRSRNWGLSRITIDQKQFLRIPSNGTWVYDNTTPRWKNCLSDDLGKNTTIYIVDENGYRTEDFNQKPGRLTAFAGTVTAQPGVLAHAALVTDIAAGDTYGVARDSTIKVWAKDKEISTASALGGMEAILQHRKSLSADDAKKPAVLNCSFGDFKGPSKASDDLLIALRRVLDAGIIIVAAAGNVNVCGFRL
ncbi:hypothetical protein A1O7_09956 [Cladophialophora yegresii CBS 114405]|uniref:Inhibitor I9 domain-containing protein n=1 Tax=Cladophialophora yegresii CBS 114405 TaxID=1182544 RepID=W9VNN4_9EURO|nr:uncharacterized protein A1O7_09956 [Cladophialophora yegresii CBS 114405]EXJ54615.1 hypothetical protein A1O7_09956 [Cladophialophora yegresii CBS 114405]